MQALINFWTSIPLKGQLAIIGLVGMVAKDVYNFFVEFYKAKDAGEKPPTFKWGLAIPMWVLGTMGGLGVGTGIEALPVPE